MTAAYIKEYKYKKMSNPITLFTSQNANASGFLVYLFIYLFYFYSIVMINNI